MRWCRGSIGVLMVSLGLVLAACSSGSSSPVASAGKRAAAGIPKTTTSTTATTTTTAPPTVSTTAPTQPQSPTTTAPAAAMLGVAWGTNPGVAGFGLEEPANISLGGADPTGSVSGVTWQNWGADQAMGQGTAEYQAPGQPAANATQAQATVVAFKLGACFEQNNTYEAIEWYFPEYGQSFDPNSYFDACTGASVSPST